jgi:uncharacterized damage-inducible protein DinB
MNLHPSLISRLKTQHESIPLIIANVDKTALERNPAAGKWSIKDNIAHLARYQPMFIWRINEIMERDTPVFDRYNADTDTEFPSWQIRETDDLLRQLSADRKTIFSLITTLKADQLPRAGIHPKFGKLNIPDWVEFFLLHEAHHLFTIFQLTKSRA